MKVKVDTRRIARELSRLQSRREGVVAELEEEPQTLIFCDICGEEAPVEKCDICGIDVCAFCRATVHFFQKETVRGLEIPFVYDRVICQSHLPKGFTHSDGSEVDVGSNS